MSDTSYSFRCAALELHNFQIICSTTNNQPPRIPSNPLPNDNTFNVDPETTLSWSGGDPDSGDTVTYDIYFGKTSNPPLVASNYLSLSYDPGILDYNSVYYWKIVARDSNGASTEGPIWEFTTKDSDGGNQIVSQEPSSKTSSVKLFYMSQKILNVNGVR